MDTRHSSCSCYLHSLPCLFVHAGRRVAISKLFEKNMFLTITTVKTPETRKKSFQIILRPDVIIALFLFPRGATKCSSRAMWSPEAGGEETGELLTAPGRSKNTIQIVTAMLSLLDLRQVTMGSIHLRAEISGQARISGPKPKFQPGILAWKKRAENFGLEFQARISSQNSRPKNVSNFFSCFPNVNNGISKSDNSSLNPNSNSQLPPPSAVIQNGGPSETVASAAVTTTPGMASNATYSRQFVFVLVLLLSWFQKRGKTGKKHDCKTVFGVTLNFLWLKASYLLPW